MIHFYNERVSFLFYCEDGKRGAVSWLSLNAVEVKQTSHLLDICRFRLFLWQFGAPSINEVRMIPRHSCQGFCSISGVGPQGICVWSDSLKGGAGNTYMPLHDHPYSDVNIIYSVVQTGERTTDQGTNSASNIKRLCNGEYRPGQQHSIQSSSPRYHWCRCTCTMYKTGCIKDGGKRKILKKPSNCQRKNRNLQTSSKWEVCLTSTAFNESQLTAPRFPSSQ
jgi:hypothetical protein